MGITMGIAKRIILPFIPFLFLVAAEAQDSILLHKNFSITPFMGMDRLAPNVGLQQVAMPSHIKNLRLQNPNFTGSYTNYPQWHFSLFAGLASKWTLKDGYSLQFTIIGEDRAGSYGVLKIDNFVVFPQIQAKIQDTIRLGKWHFPVKVHAGDMVNFKHQNGLSIYHVDVQGADVTLGFKNWFLGFTSITDLSQHVGLQVGEVYAYHLGLKKLKISPKRRLRLVAGYDYIPEFYSFISPVISRFSANLTHVEKPTEWYAEFGYRQFLDNANAFFVTPPNFQESLAGLLGYSIKVENKKRFRSYQRAELRYYGYGYNYRRISTSTRYLSPTASSFIGRYLYPLRNAYRPMNQWAVFTEYQNKNVGAFCWDSRNRLKLFGNFWLQANVEWLAILAQDEPAFLYTLYETGLVFQPVKGLDIMVYASNKVMNLDVHYQTFYQSQRPMFGYSLRKKLLPQY